MQTFLLAVVLLLIGAAATFAQCPTISVIGPAGVTNPGERMIFRVEVGAVGPKAEYKWIVTAGTIVEGQGTPVIKVATDRSSAGGNITATVIVEGLLFGCDKAASETAPVAQIPEWEPVDEWGSLSPNDQRSRFDSFFFELANNPHNIGLVVLYIPHKERFDSRNKRIKFVLDHARFRKFDLSRIWFSLERWIEPRTRIYGLPPELAGDIPCNGCLIIKGGDLKREPSE
jgi:hypothetical protein